MIWKPTNYKKTNLRSVSEKGFLQDVRHNLWDIVPDEGAVAGYGN